MNKHNQKQERIKVGERVTLVRRGKRGIWQMDFHCRGHRQVSTRTANLKFARQCAIRLEAQLLEGTFEPGNCRKPKAKKATLSAAVADFVAYHRTEGTRPKTIVRYRGILTRFQEFAATKRVRHVADVTLAVVDRYRASRKPHLSDKTMHHEGALLKSFFRWCEERDLVNVNPMAKWKSSHPKRRNQAVLTLEQVHAILEAATPLRRPVLAMLAYTGMRIGECRNLKVEDVDLQGNWIYIRSRPGYETKTGEERKIPIHPDLRAVLSLHRPNKCGWYFTALPSPRYPDGKHHINPKHINEDLQALLKKLAIPSGRASGGFTAHSFRHFFKTFCITNGIPKPIVDEWQGHSLGTSPSDHYFHLTEEESQAQMKKVPFESQ